MKKAKSFLTDDEIEKLWERILYDDYDEHSDMLLKERLDAKYKTFEEREADRFIEETAGKCKRFPM